MLRKLFFICLVLLFVNLAFGQEKPQVINKCWEYKSDQMSGFRIASDNVNQIIIPQTDAKLISLNQHGEIIWQTDLGGNLLTEIIISEEYAYFVLQNLNSQDSFNFRAISLETGLTVWEKVVIENLKDKSLKISKNGDQFITINDNTHIYIIDTLTRNIFTMFTKQSEINSNIELKGDSLFFVSQNNELVEYSIKNQEFKKYFDLKNENNNLFIGKNNELILTNNIGQISQYNKITGKINWRIRAGAKINQIWENDKQYYMASFDNYLYSVDSKSGKFNWKKRLDGRIGSLLLPVTFQIVSSIINGQTTTFTELNKGKTVYQILLEGDSIYTNYPVLLNQLIILSSNKGIAAYSYFQCK